MKPFLVAAIALALTVGVAVKSGSVQSDGQPPPHGRFKKLAKEAKEKGQTQVTTPSFTHTEYAGQIDNLDFLLQNYSFVVAELVWQDSYVAPSYDEVTTWSKFRATDVLSQTERVNDSSIAPPAELSNINPDEFLLAQVGGSLSIDGVRVKVEDKSFPLLKPGKRYLLVMSKNESGVAILAGGPTGVFTVSGQGIIKPLVERRPSFQDSVLSELGQALGDIRSRIQARRAGRR